MPHHVQQMREITTAYKEIPQIIEPSPKDLSRELLNNKVNEVSIVLNMETQEIEKCEKILRETEEDLVEIKKEEQTWTSYIIELLSNNHVTNYILSSFWFFKFAKNKLENLKSREEEDLNNIKSNTEKLGIVTALKTKHSNYQEQLIEEITTREQNQQKKDRTNFSYQAVYDLFDSNKVNENGMKITAEEIYNRGIPILKVFNGDMAAIRLEDVTEPIMRFDGGFVIKQDEDLNIGFDKKPQLQFFYLEKNDLEGGNWKTWTPPGQIPHVKIDGFWIQKGKQTVDYRTVQYLIEKVQEEKEIREKVDFDPFEIEGF